jgi:hypothetical protein
MKSATEYILDRLSVYLAVAVVTFATCGTLIYQREREAESYRRILRHFAMPTTIPTTNEVE